MVEFKVWAPNAHDVALILGDSRLAMEPGKGGWWRLEVSSGGIDMPYAFAIDGGEPLPDPRSQHQPDGVDGRSVRVNHDSFQWRHPAYRPPPLAHGVIYELHVGTFTPEGTFAAAQSKLEHLKALGVTHVELMPIAEFAGTRGWGYDGVDLFAPYTGYGTPEQLKAFVDACHALDLAVILDVVYNHLGPAGNYLEHFGPYFTDLYATPWGKAVNLDQAGSAEVRAFFLDNAMMWLRDYNMDGLRLDAVHAYFDRAAVPFLEELANAVHALSIARGRQIVLIAESNLNDPKLVMTQEAGGFGLDAAWSDDFHHALHALLTGERSGYYADFGSIEALAKALKDVFVYDGVYSAHRNRPHGRPVAGVHGSRFVVSTQTHDQVGNRARGERLCHLVGSAKAKIAAGLLFMAGNVPMLFQGEEWAASTPFFYFTDHEPELGRLVSEGRRREFESFGWAATEVPDPQAVETFEASRLRWDELEAPVHAEMLEWYRQLAALRRAHGACVPVTHGGFSEEERWLSFTRGELEVVVNLSGVGSAIPLGEAGVYEVLLASGAASLGEGAVDLAPDSIAILKRR